MRRDSIRVIALSSLPACPAIFCGEINGIDPSTGNPSVSTSSMVLSDRSMYSLRNTRPMPWPRPTMTARSKSNTFLGLIGSFGGLAYSTILTNPFSPASAMRFSSNFVVSIRKILPFNSASRRSRARRNAFSGSRFRARS